MLLNNIIENIIERAPKSEIIRGLIIYNKENTPIVINGICSEELAERMITIINLFIWGFSETDSLIKTTEVFLEKEILIINVISAFKVVIVVDINSEEEAQQNSKYIFKSLSTILSFYLKSSACIQRVKIIDELEKGEVIINQNDHANLERINSYSSKSIKITSINQNTLQAKIKRNSNIDYIGLSKNDVEALSIKEGDLVIIDLIEEKGIVGNIFG